MILLISMYVPSFIPVLIDKSLSAAGVADWHIRRYQIDESRMPMALFTRSEWKVSPLVAGKSFTVEGILIYSLNNVKLLCPATIKNDYLNMLHFVPWDKDYDKKQGEVLKKHAARCQSFIQGGVARIVEE
ncbi:hypothetical protein XBJ1_1472 [Xenorhabdus bovienii SS-2004]|uniref:Uncharacterized protein n=2 Tax=Xenorhabdus bovienii TaxID=40576 RepID=D3V049_XENBS|nr:hypothetical protein XBJ1_1472 [Xenorhabdus bovienii SS-2004]